MENSLRVCLGRALSIFTLTLSLALPLLAANEKTLYTFATGAGGNTPFGGLAFDAQGNLYGTTLWGGTPCPGVGCGTVFELRSNGDGSWTQSTLYSFAGGSSDFAYPSAHVTFDRGGNIYGTAQYNLNPCPWSGCGGVFRLTPSGAGWKESIAFAFDKRTGDNPFAGLTLYKGDLYGTTEFGPARNGAGYGTVFQLESGPNFHWKHHVIHFFQSGTDGLEPQSDVVFDKQGNLYGTIPYGGANVCGDIFEFFRDSHGSRKEKVLYSFSGLGCGGGGSVYPTGLILDSAGNLYGATSGGGVGCTFYGCGTVFELQRSKTGWRKITLYEFAGGNDGDAPAAGLVMDSRGNLYGATSFGGTGNCQFFGTPGCGTVFKLTHGKGNHWNKTTLYNFTGGGDGMFPNFGSLILDAVGDLYGATQGDGKSNFGTVYEILP
jgi:uncharacterized repeat protein (TIGR03803 family)